MIVVRQVLTADNTDVLNGTDLESIPLLGLLSIWAASTQADTLITITGPENEPPIRAQALALRTNGQPLKNEDSPYMVGVIQGGRYIVDINVVTAATVVVEAIYNDLSEL